MIDTLDMLKALADENRLRILCALRAGELCVCQVIALLELAPSTVSKHLSVLRAARWVQSRKSGRWMHYRLSENFRTAAASKMLDLLCGELEETERLVEDRKRLGQIREEGMESLCKRLFCKK
ncbi:MAG: winged helix-turn-helix transcriptional regulator [Lentisphaerae bacterium]|jgi:DNA-binding transcriptional ArsR family regulator|nr:winged helix-turn-helix transcriptional regulator [Lentisphaerota bacterium]